MTIWSLLVPIIFFLIITVVIAFKYYYSQRKTTTPTPQPATTPTPAPTTPAPATTTPRATAWQRARPWIIGIVAILLVLWLGSGVISWAKEIITPKPQARAKLQSEYSLLATADKWSAPIPVKPGAIRFFTIPDVPVRIQVPAGNNNPEVNYVAPAGVYFDIRHESDQKAWRFRALDGAPPVQVQVWWEK